MAGPTRKDSKPGRSRGRALIATLVATIALVGVEQALTAATAGAVMQVSEECTDPFVFLVDCEEENGGGGGGPEGGWGGGSDGADPSVPSGETLPTVVAGELAEETARQDEEDRARAAQAAMEKERQQEMAEQDKKRFQQETQEEWVLRHMLDPGHDYQKACEANAAPSDLDLCLRQKLLGALNDRCASVEDGESGRQEWCQETKDRLKDRIGGDRRRQRHRSNRSKGSNG